MLSSIRPIMADTIFLRNGEVLTGEIIENEKATITIKLADGKKKKLSKYKIMKISHMDGQKEKITTNEDLLKQEKIVKKGEVIKSEGLDATHPNPEKINVNEVIKEANKDKKKFPPIKEKKP